MSIINNADGTLSFNTEKSILLSSVSITPEKAPLTPVERIYGGREYASWGTDNNYPLEVYDRIANNSIIRPALAWIANQLGSVQLQYGYIDGYDSKRNEIFIPEQIEEIEEFLEINSQKLYMEECIRDLKILSHAFVEFRLNSSRTKIATLSCYDATHCRFSVQNQKTGNKDFVFVDANWPKGRKETWKKIANLDPYWDVCGQIKDRKAGEYIYPLSFSSPGKIYYQDTPWHSIINSNWLDVMEKIPAFKKYLMEHQMTVKYIVHVPESWWLWKYPKWVNMSEEQRKTARKTESETFNNLLTGVEKTGKSLFLTFKDSGQATNSKYTKWEVQEMNGSFGDGTYIEDSQEASDHALFSLTLHGTLVGKTPGKGMGAGSGSDIRVSNNVFFINNKVYLDKAAMPYEIITRYNKWKSSKPGKRLVWRPLNFLIDTADKASEVTTSTPSTNGK